MTDQLLRKVDLNLLRALYVLLLERNVTRAAARLFITQPAMSRSLQRLRDLFDDPLFIRTHKGLIPTPRAIDLLDKLSYIFSQIDQCVSPLEFDPKSIKGRVKLALPEQFAIAIIPKILRNVSIQAPGLCIETQDITEEYHQNLNNGTINFAVTRFSTNLAGFHSTHLYTASAMLWCRKNHPLTKIPNIGLRDIFKYPQIAFRTPYATHEQVRSIRQELSEINLSLNIILDTSHLMVAIDSLMGNDFVMLAPNYLHNLPFATTNLESISISHIPIFDHLYTKLVLIENEKFLNSPLQKWMAGQILTVCESL